jgi:actin-related protein
MLLPQVREKTVELMFEKFNVPALFMARNAALSSFATARQTALVVDAGHRSTTGKQFAHLGIPGYQAAWKELGSGDD